MVGILGRGDSCAKAQWYDCIVFRERQSDQARQKIRRGEGSEAGKGGWYQVAGCLKTQHSVGRGAPWRVLEQESILIRAVLKQRRWQPLAGWIRGNQEMAELVKRLVQ